MCYPTVKRCGTRFCTDIWCRATIPVHVTYVMMCTFCERWNKIKMPLARVYIHLSELFDFGLILCDNFSGGKK